MYESKYAKYITKNTARFAEPEEIMSSAQPAFTSTPSAGIPLYNKEGRLYVDNEDNHTFVIGPTGCKKSRTAVFSTVASIIESGESAIVNDPKGEIYRKTAGRAQKKGAKVYQLNFRKPSASAPWNPLLQSKRFYEAGKTDEALQCIADFAESVVAPAAATTVDIYWAETSKIFLTSLVLMLMDSVPTDYYNLKTMIPFCYENNETYLKKIVTKMDETSTAVFGLRAVIDLVAEKTKSCIYSTLMSILRPFVQNTSLLEMLSGKSFDIESIGKEQTLIYVIYPDEKENLNFLVNLFLTQSYETLVSVAGDSNGDRLPIRVNYVLDEFSNLVAINNFDNRISEARSKNIRYFLFVQSYAQLKNKYKECAETIISNCNNWICFSSKEMEFLEKISKICGMEVDYNGIEHSLISAFDMQYFEKRMESSEVLIIKQGHYPFITPLPDFDYLGISALYNQTPPSETHFHKAVSITPLCWYNNISLGKFKVPFPKAINAA